MSSTITLPSSVKIGWKFYRIEDWNPEIASRANMYGECDHIESVIRVDVTKGDRQAVETLLHECLHAAAFIGYLGERDEEDNHTEERVVSFFASWLTTLFCDNPELAHLASALSAMEA